MAIRNVVKEGDEVLRKKSRTVSVFDEKLWQLLDDMAETLYEYRGFGLAAPQVGVLKRVVVIDDAENEEYYEIINPEIIEAEGEQQELEGCLSIPGEWGITNRPARVKVKAFDRNGEVYYIEGTELLARGLCHEIDHLNGILYKDNAVRMLTKDEIDEMFSDEEQE